MAIHVAILKLPYLRDILAGRKTIESRLTRTAMPPFGIIQPGQRIYFKVSAGPFMARAIAQRIDAFDRLTPTAFQHLEQRYRPAVGGTDEYWQMKRDSNYAVFIHLAHVEPIDVGPAYTKANMKAWHVLDDRLDPVHDVTLTPGAIRNAYVSAPLPQAGTLQGPCLELLMPDGLMIETDFAHGSMLRWRGWRRYFQSHHVQPGDTVRFVSLGGRRYRVSFRQNIRGANRERQA